VSIRVIANLNRIIMRLAMLFGLLAVINTCHEKEKDPEPICWFESPCIYEKITQIMSEPVRNPKVSVTFIRTQSGYYYLISGYCCDVPSVLLDHDCKVVCHSDGGIATRSESCPELANEIERYVIWEDKR
jgi:hypothetical protein